MKQLKLLVIIIFLTLNSKADEKALFTINLLQASTMLGMTAVTFNNPTLIVPVSVTSTHSIICDHGYNYYSDFCQIFIRIRDYLGEKTAHTIVYSQEISDTEKDAILDFVAVDLMNELAGDQLQYAITEMLVQNELKLLNLDQSSPNSRAIATKQLMQKLILASSN